MDEEIFELHADVCRTLSNSKRLKILNALRDGEMQVSMILAKMGRIGKANLSQHLAVMRQKGVVATRREGNLIYYRISSPKIIQACDLMREVLFEQLEGKGALFLRYAKSAGTRHERHARPSAHSRSARSSGLQKTPAGTRS
jgi:DNA-binding transcriptional ArsR family regulator